MCCRFAEMNSPAGMSQPLMSVTRAECPAATENTQMTNRKNKKPAAPQPTASEVYAARRGDVARLLDVLEMELTKHDEKISANPKAWGLTGNLEKMRSDLIDLVAFAANMERERIEEFLDDAA